MAKSLDRRLQAIERRYRKDRAPVEFVVWSRDEQTGEMVNEKTGEQLSQMAFERRQHRFTLLIPHPDGIDPP